MMGKLSRDEICRLEKQIFEYYPKKRPKDKKKRIQLRAKLKNQLASEARVVLPTLKGDLHQFREFVEPHLAPKSCKKPGKVRKCVRQHTRKPPQTIKYIKLLKNTRTVILVPPGSTIKSKQNPNLSAPSAKTDGSENYFKFKLIIPPNFGNISVDIEYQKKLITPHILIPPFTTIQNPDTEQFGQIVPEQSKCLDVLKKDDNVHSNIVQPMKFQSDGWVGSSNDATELAGNEESENIICLNCKKLLLPNTSKDTSRTSRTSKKAAESTMDDPVKKRRRKPNKNNTTKNIKEYFEEFGNSFKTSEASCNYYNYPQIVTSTTKDLESLMTTNENPKEWDNNSPLQLSVAGKEGTSTAEQQILGAGNNLLFQVSIPNLSNDLKHGEIVSNNKETGSYDQATQHYEESVFRNLQLQGQYLEQSKANKQGSDSTYLNLDNEVTVLDVKNQFNYKLDVLNSFSACEYKDTLYQAPTTSTKEWVNASSSNTMTGNLAYCKENVTTIDSKDLTNGVSNQYESNFQNSFYTHLLSCDYDTKIHSNTMSFIENEIALLDPSEMYESLQNDENTIHVFEETTFNNDSAREKSDDSVNTSTLSSLNNDSKSKSGIEILSVVPLPAIKEIGMPKNEVEFGSNDDKKFIHNSTHKPSFLHTKEESGSNDLESKKEHIDDEAQKDNFVQRNTIETCSTLSKLSAELSDINFENEVDEDDDVLSLTTSSIGSDEERLMVSDFENSLTPSRLMDRKRMKSGTEEEKRTTLKGFKIPKIKKTEINVKVDQSGTPSNHACGNLTSDSGLHHQRQLNMCKKSQYMFAEHSKDSVQDNLADNLMEIVDVAKIFGVTCLGYLSGNGQCFQQCNLSHTYNDPKDVQNFLESFSESNLNIAYRFMYNHKQHFNRYFEVFCKIYALKKSTGKLYNMVRDSERYEQGGHFIPALYNGLLLCGISKYDACSNILKLVKNQKRFVTVNNLLSIIVDADWKLFVNYIDTFAQLPRYKFHKDILHCIAATAVQEKTYVTIFVKCLTNLNENDFDNLRTQGSEEVKKLLELLSAAYQCGF